MASLRFTKALWQQRELWWRLTTREVSGRYRGSMVGLGWSFVTPLLMLAVYTFIFSQVFQSRWGDLEQLGSMGFAINLFAGMIVFNLFNESATKAPDLVVANPNYVTKLIFPLHVLAAVNVASATFHALTSLVILIGFKLVAVHTIQLSFLWLPLVWLPLIAGSLALSWVLSALGVFLRDISQVVGVVTSMLMFLSAVFYPVSSLPLRWQPVLMLNPLVIIIEQTRRVTVSGLNPSLMYIVIGCLIGLVCCEVSFRCFQRARHGFADVL